MDKEAVSTEPLVVMTMLAVEKMDKEQIATICVRGSGRAARSKQGQASPWITCPSDGSFEPLVNRNILLILCHLTFPTLLIGATKVLIQEQYATGCSFCAPCFSHLLHDPLPSHVLHAK